VQKAAPNFRFGTEK